MKTLAVFILAMCSMGAAAQSVNYSNTTPAAPPGAVNVHWQHDAANPVNVSANVPIGGGSSIGSSDVLNQTTSQSSVNLVTSLSGSGKYRINYYVDQNALCATGSMGVILSFSWTDSSHARTASTVSLTLGNLQSSGFGSIQGVIPIYGIGSSAITYTSTISGTCSTGSPASYDAHIFVEAIS